MGTFDIPLWIKILAVFVAALLVFALAAWDIIFDWISDEVKRRFRGKAKY